MSKFFLDSNGVVVGECVSDDPVNPNKYDIVKIDGHVEVGVSVVLNGVIQDLDKSLIYSKFGINELIYRLNSQNSCSYVKANTMSNNFRSGINVSPISYMGITLGVMVNTIQSTGDGLVTYTLSKLLDESKLNGVHIYGEIYNPRFSEVVRKLGVDIYKLTDEVDFAWFNPDKFSESSKRNRLVDNLSTYLQSYLDAEVSKYGYYNVSSVCMRTGYEGPYREECTKLSKWIDDCWDTWYKSLESISTSDLLSINIKNLLGLLPILKEIKNGG